MRNIISIYWIPRDAVPIVEIDAVENVLKGGLEL